MAKRDRSTPGDQEVRIQVMKAEHGRYYVNARAGTGKTESLAKRVAYALQLEDNGTRVYQPSDMPLTNSEKRKVGRSFPLSSTIPTVAASPISDTH